MNEIFWRAEFEARDILQEEAVRADSPFVNYRWLGGMLTNYKTIRQSIKRLKELESMFEKNIFGRLTKKEILQLTREKTKLDRVLGGIKNMGSLPDALFVIDVGHENIAVAEANRLSIPVLGVVDTNNSPDGITYVIPGNDDSVRSVELYTRAVADCILEARASNPELVVEEFGEVEEEVAETPSQNEEKGEE